MNRTKTLSYPGVLRAFNKIEEQNELANKNEILSILSTLIDAAIQKELECIRHQCKTISRRITISDRELKNLLEKLEENNVVLYDSVPNEEALILHKNYRMTNTGRTKLDSSRCKYGKKIKFNK